MIASLTLSFISLIARRLTNTRATPRTPPRATLFDDLIAEIIFWFYFLGHLRKREAKPVNSLSFFVDFYLIEI